MNSPPGAGADPPKKLQALAGKWASTAGQAMQQWTSRKYTLPDKNVASQVLMYRQLLHTKCRIGLKLSREYQGTPAQVAVKHMPWWSKGIEETKRMEIAYDNLIRRLWLHAAILPHNDVETLLDDNGMPPIPHDFWVARAGFQQTDPVTDFRSGGVLSLAMMVWVCESCPAVFQRFVRPRGDASVLPFGITSINITDMMAKFLMLSKATDRMDALLSQKPFWRMFADPNSLLACQELSMDLLADVVVELRKIREAEAEQLTGDDKVEQTAEAPPKEELVTVFDFAHILAVTEKRVELDLLGAGPGSVVELREVHKRLKVQYQQKLEQKLLKIRDGDAKPQEKAQAAAKQIQQQVVQQATGLGAVATSLAGNVFQKIKSPVFNPLRPKPGDTPTSATASSPSAIPTDIDDQGVSSPTVEATNDNGSPPAKEQSVAAAVDAQSNDSDWTGTDIEGAAEQIGNFSIGADDDAMFSIGDADDSA